MKKKLESAVVFLQKADGRLATVIDRVGPCRLRPNRDRFGMIVRSILSQQVSTRAAATIRDRLTAKAGSLTPEAIHPLSDEELRSVGVSPQKSRYLRDLVDRVQSGELELTKVGRLDDEEVISRLITVKGVGRWTAEMFLIFSLGRLDVLPVDDLGIKNAMRKLYELEELPTPSEMREIGSSWRPYASVASWYCWRSLENDPT